MADVSATQGPVVDDSARLAVAVEDVHVTYHVYEQRRADLRQVIARRSRPSRGRAIDAVRGVSFELALGEAVGLIGPNGSGKSTLLRSVAGLLPPTSGQVLVRSRPMLLGVGAALKPELSGRHNIMIGCLALGLSRAETTERERSVIEFAGLADFIDLPMRTYSSGMRARLHFSIATAVTPEILLIDEALAVGDRKFKRRSAERIREIRENAGTVILVSHNLNEVASTCSRAIWLEAGKVVQDGPAEAVIDAYNEASDLE